MLVQKANRLPGKVGGGGAAENNCIQHCQLLKLLLLLTCDSGIDYQAGWRQCAYLNQNILLITLCFISSSSANVCLHAGRNEASLNNNHWGKEYQSSKKKNYNSLILLVSQ